MPMLAALTLVLAVETHIVRDIEGWNVHIDQRLFAGENRSLGARSLRLLSNQLYAIKDVVPEDRLRRLQQVPIWLELNNKTLRSPQYHPSAAWLRQNGYPVALAKAVHLPEAEYFASRNFQVTQPWAVMHELAHAYHDQVLGFENAEVKAAWEKYRARKENEPVLHHNGRTQKHYALTNQMEYFAEMSESFFGTNDFFPFVRAELQHDDPETFALMRKIWLGQ